MDVLQIIKNEHTEIKTRLQNFSESSGIIAKRKSFKELMDFAIVHLKHEGGFLYPEINDLYPTAESFVKKSESSHRSLKRGLTELDKILKKNKNSKEYLTINRKFNALSKKFNDHLELEESELMPKIRELISTQDREDLGQVLIDFKEDSFQPS